MLYPLINRLVVLTGGDAGVEHVDGSTWHALEHDIHIYVLCTQRDQLITEPHGQSHCLFPETVVLILVWCLDIIFVPRDLDLWVIFHIGSEETQDVNADQSSRDEPLRPPLPGNEILPTLGDLGKGLTWRTLLHNKLNWRNALKTQSTACTCSRGESGRTSCRPCLPLEPACPAIRDKLSSAGRPSYPKNGDVLICQSTNACRPGSARSPVCAASDLHVAGSVGWGPPLGVPTSKRLLYCCFLGMACSNSRMHGQRNDHWLLSSTKHGDTSSSQLPAPTTTKKQAAASSTTASSTACPCSSMRRTPKQEPGRKGKRQ